MMTMVSVASWYKVQRLPQMIKDPVTLRLQLIIFFPSVCTSIGCIILPTRK
jgi:hypothetical protein